MSDENNNTPRMPAARSRLHEETQPVDPDFDDEGAAPEKIQRGMPGRNIKTMLTVILGLAAAAFLLWPQQKKAQKNEEPPAQVQAPAQAENLVASLVRESEKPAPAPTLPLPAPFQPQPPIDLNVNMQGSDKPSVEDERKLESLMASTAATGVELKSNLPPMGSKPAADILSVMEAQQAKNDQALREAQEFAQRMSTQSVDPAVLLAQTQAPRGPSHSGFLEKQAVSGASSFGPALQLQDARKSHSLYEGTIVRTVLTRALKTDLPGMVTAKVTTDLYDTVTQRTLLVPRGSEVTCSYQSELLVGQELVLMACNRLRLPNGKSFSLAGATGSDVLGASGLPADINNHFWKIFKNALIIGAASALLPKADRNISSTTGDSGATTAGTILGTTLSKVVDITLNRNISIPVTGQVEIGTPFTLTLSRDVELEPYLR